MTLDEAISHALEVAEQEEKNSKTGKWFEGEDWNIKAREQCAECAADHRQLAEWLKELKGLREKYREVVMEGEILNADYTEQVALNEQYKNREQQYKRLLKAAMEHIEDGDCKYCAYNNGVECPAADIGCGFKWIHKDEALKLIGETNDEP